MTPALKVQEVRLRNVAERQGLRLERCRRRDQRAIGYGLYRLVSGDGADSRAPYDLTLDEVATELGEDDRVPIAS